MYLFGFVDMHHFPNIKKALEEEVIYEIGGL